MPGPSYELRFQATADFDRHWRDHLSRGGAWLGGTQLAHDAACVLVLIGPAGAQLTVHARAVFVDASGTGLAIEQFSPAMRAQLEALRDGGAPTSATGPIAIPPTGPIAIPPTGPIAVTPTTQPIAIPGDDDDDDDADATRDDEDDDAPPRDPVARNVFERLRHLTLQEQYRVAREGETHERVALERMYGKSVWEPILRNPRVSHPEIARISRMGNLPRPLIEIIVANGGWLKSPEVRRSLLANPRLATDQALRILRLMTKQELKLVPLQTTYPAAVRDAARRMLLGS
ncbi:MAG: hypothetical protein K8W52_24390 [Deltaproteobacteria bacterium]|nr:hypothetical protein [Deltaproteobacteria bacterium]